MWQKLTDTLFKIQQKRWSKNFSCVSKRLKRSLLNQNINNLILFLVIFYSKVNCKNHLRWHRYKLHIYFIFGKKNPCSFILKYFFAADKAKIQCEESLIYRSNCKKCVYKKAKKSSCYKRLYLDFIIGTIEVPSLSNCTLLFKGLSSKDWKQ